MVCWKRFYSIFSIFSLSKFSTSISKYFNYTLSFTKRGKERLLREGQRIVSQHHNRILVREVLLARQQPTLTPTLSRGVLCFSAKKGIVEKGIYSIPSTDLLKYIFCVIQFESLNGQSVQYNTIGWLLDCKRQHAQKEANDTTTTK